MNVSLRLSLSHGTQTETAPRYSGYRCLHVPEGGYPSDNGNPEVRPSKTVLPVPMTQPVQKLSYDINENNPFFGGGSWRAVYTYKRAFTNGNGFDEPNDPRVDYINGLDIGAPVPKLMDGIICGGMFIRGEVVGSDLVCTPGVHAIDANKPLPTVEEVMARNWYFTAVTQNDGHIYHFPQGHGLPVLIPYILRQPARYPLAWFVRWEADTLPDPLRLYHPMAAA